MLTNPLLIHKVFKFKGNLRGCGLRFGRIFNDESPIVLPPARPMWICFPSRMAVRVSQAHIYPRGEDRTFEEALVETLETSGQYVIDPGVCPLPSCPLVIVPSQSLEVGMVAIALQLQVRSIADLAEYSAHEEYLSKIAERLGDEPFVPGMPLPKPQVTVRDAARRVLLSRGMHLVVEPAGSIGTEAPFVVRLMNVATDGHADGLLFWVGKEPTLRRGDELWRYMDPAPPENDKHRAVRIATVLKHP